MRRLPWRHLVLAIAAGVASYFACEHWWPEQTPRKSIQIERLRQNGRWRTLELSSDSSLLAFWEFQRDGHVEGSVRRTSDGSTLATGWFHGSAFSPKGDLFTLYNGTSLHIYEGQTGKQLSIHDFNGNIRGARFGPDGVIHLLINTRNGGTSFQRLEPTEAPDEMTLSDSGFHSLTGEWAIVRKRSEFRIWNIVSREQLLNLTTFGVQDQVVISNDGGTLLFAQSRQMPKILDVQTEESRAMPFQVRDWRDVRLSPDGTLAAGDFFVPTAPVPAWFQRIRDFLGVPIPVSVDQRGVTIYNTRNGQEVANFPKAALACFSGDGKSLALLNPDGKVELWDLPLKSLVPYWILIGFTVAVTFFIALRLTARRHSLARDRGMLTATHWLPEPQAQTG